jgi:hypothetical protein
VNGTPWTFNSKFTEPLVLHTIFIFLYGFKNHGTRTTARIQDTRPYIGNYTTELPDILHIPKPVSSRIYAFIHSSVLQIYDTLNSAAV